MAGMAAQTLRSVVMVVVLCMVALSGCATVYQPLAFSGGYSDLQLAASKYRVTFQGNGYTSRERVVDMLLLRAADLTLANGRSHFAVLAEGRDAQIGFAMVSGSPVVFTKHRGEMTFQLLDTEQPGSNDAQLISRQLRQRYGISD
jgi:uncharacterized protein YceK